MSLLQAKAGDFVSQELRGAVSGGGTRVCIYHKKFFMKYFLDYTQNFMVILIKISEMELRSIVNSEEVQTSRYKFSGRVPRGIKIGINVVGGELYIPDDRGAWAQFAGSGGGGGSVVVDGTTITGAGTIGDPLVAHTDTSGLVPYTGASSNVNLGAHSLTIDGSSLTIQDSNSSGAVNILTPVNAGFVKTVVISQPATLGPSVYMRNGNTDDTVGGGIARVGNNVGELRIYSNRATFGGNPQSSMTFHTNGTEKMSIADGGQVKLTTYGAASYTGTIARLLAVNTSGDVIEANVVNGLSFSSGNILLGGSLTQSTAITGGSIAATWSGSNASQTIDFSNTSSGAALQARNTSTGMGINITTTSGTGLNVNASTSGTAISASSSTGSGMQISTASTSAGLITASSAGGIILTGQIQPTTSSTISPILKLVKQATTTNSNGTGVSIDMYGANASNTQQVATKLIAKLTDVTALSPISEFSIQTVDATNGTQDTLKLAGTGQLTLPLYGAGTFTGTAARILMTTSAGAVIEGAVATGVAAFLANPTSANLAAAITDEVGNGFLVFNNSSTFTSNILMGSTLGVNTNTQTFRTTNGGSNVTASAIMADLSGSVSSAGALGIALDSTVGGMSFTGANGTRRISRAYIALANLNNTAGSEAGDLAFGTQTGGAVATERLRITALGGFVVNATNTAGGTTGAQTINKPSGTVNLAASATSLVVTNSLVTTSSIVWPVVMTNDASTFSLRVVVASGSFTIHVVGTAPAAETKVGFFVLN